jgi:hypothetical protein
MSHWKSNALSPHSCSPGDQISAEVDILIPEEDGDPGDMVDDRLNPRIEEISRNRRI